MAEEELRTLEQEQERLEADIKLLLLPKDPNDDKSVVLEIRAGTGGDESALFAGDLFRMYSRFAEGNRWRVEIISASESEKWRLQGGRGHRRGRRGVRQAQVRIGDPPRPARTGDRGAGADPHERLHRRDAAGSGGYRHRHQSGRPEDRRLPVLRRRRPARQHHRLRGADHPPSDRRGSCLPGRAEPDQEPRQGDESPQIPDPRQHASPSRTPGWPRTGRARWGAATAASGSVPTTSRRAE